MNSKRFNKDMINKGFCFVTEMNSTCCIRQSKITCLFPDPLRITCKGN